MSQQAYKYQVSSSSWSRLTFFELKITYILKSSGWRLEKSELPWEQYVSCRTISLPSFNSLNRLVSNCAAKKEQSRGSGE